MDTIKAPLDRGVWDALSAEPKKGEGGGPFTRSYVLLRVTQCERLWLPEQVGALDIVTRFDT